MHGTTEVHHRFSRTSHLGRLYATRKKRLFLDKMKGSTHERARSLGNTPKQFAKQLMKNSDDFGVKVPRRFENVSPKMCHHYRSTRQLEHANQ